MEKRYDPSTQLVCAETWKALSPDTEVKIENTIEAALKRVREPDNTSTREIHVSVVGSLHLVSGVLNLLEE